MNFLLIKMAWRNLWRSSRRTLITVSSIFFAVVLTVMFESINYGSHEQMIGNMVRYSSGYLRIQHENYHDEPSLDNSIPWGSAFETSLQSMSDEAFDLVPRLEGFVLAASDSSTKGVFVVGMNIERERKLKDLTKYVIQGSFSDNLLSVVVGSELGRRLGIQVDDTLIVIGQGFHGMSVAEKLHVSGILKHPLKAMDESFAYVSISTAQHMFSMPGVVTGILVMPENPAESPALAKDLENAVQDIDGSVLSWQELQPELVTGIEFDRASGRVFNGILFMVIGFGIFGTVLTMTLEREREFGGLLALGMQRAQIAIMSFWEIVGISGLGLLGGFFAAIPLVYYMSNNPIPLSGDMAKTMEDFGLEPVLGFSTNPDIFFNQGLVVLAISIFIAFYPVLRIYLLNPLEAMKR